MEKDLLKIGIVVKSHGLKGQVKIGLDEFIEIQEPLNLELLFYSQKNTFQPLQVESFEWKNHFLIIKFKGLDNINDVQFLKQQSIFVAQQNSSFQAKPNWKDYLAESEFGSSKILDVMNNGRQDLIKIKIQQKSFWVPLVAIYIQKIDADQKIIYLKDLEGLM